MAWPPLVHQDVQDDLNTAHGWAGNGSLLDRLALGEQLISTGGPLWVSGRYYSALILGSTTTVAVSASRLYLTPYYSTRSRDINQLACNVTTSATGSARLGVYNADPITGFPTTLLVDGGSVLDTSTTGAKTHTITATIYGLKWLALTATASTMTALASSVMAPISGAASVASPAPANYLYPTTTYPATSALPATLVGSTWNYTNGTVPMCMIRAT